MFKKLLWHIRAKWFLKDGPRRFLMNENPSFAKFKIGDKSYGKPKILFSDGGSTLKIGKYVSIADDATIMLGGDHRVDWATTYPLSLHYSEWAGLESQATTKGGVVIGNDVWIGREALILSGVTIGNGAVIGARSVVAKDVMPYSIVVGNPARHIRFRFDETQVAELINMAWWDWPEETIRRAVPYLQCNDIAGLIEFNQKL